MRIFDKMPESVGIESISNPSDRDRALWADRHPDDDDDHRATLESIYNKLRGTVPGSTL